MKLLSMVLLLSAIWPAWSSDLVDIIKNRNANFFERSVVSEQLAELLGIDQPLPVDPAIAEICYHADICANAANNAEIDQECDPDLYDDDFPPQFGSACYLKNFREDYSCKYESGQMTLKGLEVFADILNDTKSYYMTLITNNFVEYYKLKFNVDLSVQSNIEPFKKAYPKEMEKIQKVMGASLALGSYTGNCYSQLNKFLYSKEKEMLIRYYNIYAAIIDTLEYFPEFKKKVNRGVNLPSEVLKEHHKIGNIVCYDGFTSTAVHDEKDYTDKPKNYFLKGACTQRLYISYEDNGAKPGKLIKSGSMSPTEDEVLFEPGACFRIDKVTPRDEEVDPESDDDECEDGEQFNFELTLVPSNS